MEALRSEMKAEEYDCITSLLAGAANSYRKASTLNPYPKAFIVGGNERDYDRLCDCLRTLPSPAEAFSEEAVTLELNADQQALVQFLCGDLIRLKRVDVAEVRQHFVACVASLHPNYAFELQHNAASSSVQEFETLKQKYGTQVAFHGSPIENWHCIANAGLRNFSGTDKQKTGALFGEGIYLSTSLSVAADFSRTGEGWSKSTVLGSRLRVIGCCEVVKHPEQVQRREPEQVQRGATMASVPSAYIVVESSACVQVKYLLIYTESPARKGDDRAPSPGRFKYLILFYVVLLVAIVMSRAENRAQLRYYSRKFNRTYLRKLW